MKKILFFTLIATIFISCEGPMGPRGYDGRDGLLSTWKVIQLNVAASDWQTSVDNDGINRWYTANFDIPEITKDIFLDGLVQCYLYSDGSQTLIPFAMPCENTYGDRWIQTISYKYYEGGIEIILINSDFAIAPPDDMLFVLHILY